MIPFPMRRVLKVHWPGMSCAALAAEILMFRRSFVAMPWASMPKEATGHKFVVANLAVLCLSFAGAICLSLPNLASRNFALAVLVFELWTWPCGFRQQPQLQGP